MRELGLTASPERMGPGITLALVFLLLYALDGWRQLRPARLAETRARWRRDTPFMPETSRELRHSLALVLSASVGEEILYRGFLISYLAHYTGTTALGLCLAVALPAVLFGVCHCYQGLHAVAKIALLATLFGAIFVVTGSLWIPMILHFLVDLIGMLLAPKLLTRESPGVEELP
jgi:membrane protease YdiL (CAAX protease family)